MSISDIKQLLCSDDDLAEGVVEKLLEDQVLVGSVDDTAEAFQVDVKELAETVAPKFLGPNAKVLVAAMGSPMTKLAERTQQLSVALDKVSDY